MHSDTWILQKFLQVKTYEFYKFVEFYWKKNIAKILANMLKLYILLKQKQKLQLCAKESLEISFEIMSMGFSGGSAGKKPVCQGRRCRFDP